MGMKVQRKDRRVFFYHHCFTFPEEIRIRSFNKKVTVLHILKIITMALQLHRMSFLTQLDHSIFFYCTCYSICIRLATFGYSMGRETTSHSCANKYLILGTQLSNVEALIRPRIDSLCKMQCRNPVIEMGFGVWRLIFDNRIGKLIFNVTLIIMA